MHENPLNCFLHLIAGIIIVVSLWENSIEGILVGVLIAIIGHIIQSVLKKRAIVNKKISNKKKKNLKKAALEISVGTIVIIVIAIIMLIMGIVFVRSVMCSALGLTGDLNSRIKGEVDKLFGATGAEVQCLGASGESVKMLPGQTNNVYCGIKAKTKATYSIELISYEGVISTKDEIKKWIVTDSWTGEVSPGDKILKKVIRLNIPDNAPEETLIFQVIVKKDGSLISTQDLDFEVSRTGFFKAAMC